MKRVAFSAVSLFFVSFFATSIYATTYNDAVLADNPVYYWTFDEASGNAIEQVGGNVVDELKPFGTATRGTSNAGLGNAAHVVPGTAFSAFYTADLSLSSRPCNSWITEFWYKADNADGYSGQYLVDGQLSPYTNSPAIIFDFNGGGGDSEVEIYEKINDLGRTSGLYITDSTQWNHVVIGMTQDSGNHVVAYINGVLDADFNAGSAAVFFDYYEQLAVGGHIGYSTWAMNGMLDELAIYAPGDGLGVGGFEAEVAEIAAHYNAVPEPATIALLGLGILALRRKK